MSQPEINPIEDWASEELSEVELDTLVGGKNIPDGLFDGASFTLPPINIQAKVDSSWTSYQGALGTDPSVIRKLIAANPSLALPPFPFP